MQLCVPILGKAIVYIFAVNRSVYFEIAQCQHATFPQVPQQPVQPSATMCPVNLMRPWAHRHLTASWTSSLRLKLALSKSSILLTALGWIHPQRLRLARFAFCPQNRLWKASLKTHTLDSQLSDARCEVSTHPPSVLAHFAGSIS